MVNVRGIGFRPASGDWVMIGVPDSGPTDGTAAAVGNGQLYIFGGIDWTDDTEGHYRRDLQYCSAIPATMPSTCET